MWESIGTLLGTTADATTPSSAAMFGGNLYVNAVDDPGLYVLPADAAAKLVDVDCTLEARATPDGASGGALPLTADGSPVALLLAIAALAALALRRVVRMRG